MLLLVNGYVSVIGVLGATIWASGTARARSQMHASGDGSGLSHVRNPSNSEPTCTPFTNRGFVDPPHAFNISDHSPYHTPYDWDHEKGFGTPEGADPRKMGVYRT